MPLLTADGAGRSQLMTPALLGARLVSAVRRLPQPPVALQRASGLCLSRLAGMPLTVASSQAMAAQEDSLPGDTSVQAPAERAPASQLRLAFGSCCIPHPEKAARGGEDGLFISEDKLSFGVADGVGSWILSGIDAGAYAKQLMKHACEAAKSIPSGKAAPLEMLVRAQARTHLQGSSTALVLQLEGQSLHAANVGDCCFMVVRNGESFFRSPSQQRRFNFPYQLAAGNMGDPPSCAECYTVGLQADDIVIAGSDGLWDNVFPEAATQIAAQLKWRGKRPQDLAEALAVYASQRAESCEDGPFSLGARQVGMYMAGGKVDDITVIVACVESAAKL